MDEVHGYGATMVLLEIVNLIGGKEIALTVREAIKRRFDAKHQQKIHALEMENALLKQRIELAEPHVQEELFRTHKPNEKKLARIKEEIAVYEAQMKQKRES